LGLLYGGVSLVLLSRSLFLEKGEWCFGWETFLSFGFHYHLFISLVFT